MLGSTEVKGKACWPLKPELNGFVGVVREPFEGATVPDTAMTTAEIIPCEWPVAPESRLRSSTGLGSQISDVTNHQILDWSRSGSRTCRTRTEPAPNLGFGVRCSRRAEPEPHKVQVQSLSEPAP